MAFSSTNTLLDVGSVLQVHNTAFVLIASGQRSSIDCSDSLRRHRRVDRAPYFWSASYGRTFIDHRRNCSGSTGTLPRAFNIPRRS